MSKNKNNNSNDRLTVLENKLDNLFNLIQNNFIGLSNKCDYTFAQWLHTWQAKYKSNTQSQITYKHNLRRIDVNIIPFIGHYKLFDLTSEILQDFINSMPVSNARDKIALIISGSLQKAFDLGYINKNNFKTVELKKNSSKRFNVLQPKTQLFLLKNISIQKYLQMFNFYVRTGLRFSEGLSINPLYDIDFNRKVIMLNMQDTSTKKHKREIPFLNSLFYNFDLNCNTLFPNITKNSARLYFKRFFKSHNIDAVFHSFRHTFISCCYHVGIPPLFIQKWVGHKSIVMTLDTYTHIIDNLDTPIIAYLRTLKKSLNI